MTAVGTRCDPDTLPGIVVAPFRRRSSRYLLFRFGSPDGARAFLSALPVTLGQPGDGPLVAVGLTRDGLRALGVDDAIISELDPMFGRGPDLQRLGQPDEPPLDPHCIVGVHTVDAAERLRSSAEICALATAAGMTEQIPRADGTRLDGDAIGDRRVHFGYTDGISFPDIAWDDANRRDGQVDFRNFVLGYSTNECASDPQSGAAADLVRGSSYGVFRWIYQDVAAFNRFLRDHAPALFPHLDQAAAEELLAAKLMGRWRDGTPLVRSPDRPDETLTRCNQFDYAGDPDGAICPYSAHIRVMNPRGQELAPTVRGIPSVLRRGTPYGPPLEGTEDDGRDRGLFGVFLCTNIARQVYSLSVWAQQNNFLRVHRGNEHVQDAVIGNRAANADTRFTIPGAGRVTLPAFIRGKGSALLLYPGRDTLAALAAG